MRDTQDERLHLFNRTSCFRALYRSFRDTALHAARYTATPSPLIPFLFLNRTGVSCEVLSGPPRTHKLNLGGKEVVLEITPANHHHIFRFPGLREQRVYLTLLKIACHDRCLVTKNDSDGKTSLYTYFTSRELQRELAEGGVKIGRNYLIDALEIMAKTIIVMTITDEKGGKRKIISALLPLYDSVSRKEWEANTGTKIRVGFHPLVYESVSRLDFRLINFKQLITWKSGIVRWLHLQLSHSFLYAERKLLSSESYHISLDTIFQESGLNRSKRLCDDLRRVLITLDELAGVRLIRGVLVHGKNRLTYRYDQRKVRKKEELIGGRKCITGAVFVIEAYELAEDIVTGNTFRKELKPKLIGKGAE